MKSYKVKVFKHLLKNNTIAKKGEIVKENQLTDPAASVKGKFVEEVKTSKSKEAGKDSGKEAGKDKK